MTSARRRMQRRTQMRENLRSALIAEGVRALTDLSPSRALSLVLAVRHSRWRPSNRLKRS